MRLTVKLVSQQDLDRTLTWLEARKGARGKNVHAVALARTGQLKLGRTREYYAAMGRKGAEARWSRVQGAE